MFLWFSHLSEVNSGIVVFQFTLVICGVSASPLVLNSTINHHMKNSVQSDHQFIENFCWWCWYWIGKNGGFIWDLPHGKAASGKDQFEPVEVECCAKNQGELTRIQGWGSETAERFLGRSGSGTGCTCMTGPWCEMGCKGGLACLCHQQNCTSHEGHVPNKRNAIGLATRFYHPLGVISPITIYSSNYSNGCVRSNWTGMSIWLETS